MKNWIQAGLLIALTSLAYWNSFPGAFHYDDFPEILNNPQLTQGPFPYRWFLDHYGGRPLTLWSFHWSYRLFGGEPLGYHAFSFLLHLLCVTGVYLLVRRTAAELIQAHRFEQPVPDSIPFLTALIFSLHPLQTQAVNYIWSRSVLLMAVFSLAGLLAARRHFWLALGLAQLAVWSRAEAVVLFPLLILLHRGRWKAPLLMACLNLGAFGYSLIRYAPAEIGWNHSGWLAFYLAQPVVLFKYLGMMVWPSGLNIDHHVAIPSIAWTAVALSGLAVMAAACWRLRNRYPSAVLGLIWMGVWLSPSLLIPNTDWFNESRAYLAMAGFALTMATLLAGLEAVARRPLLGAATVVACLAMAPLTLQRNALWQDDLALYRDAASKSPAKARVRYNLGSALARSGRVSEAEREFRQALRLQPGDDLSHSAIGYCAEVQNRGAEARKHYRKALQLNPDNQRARQGLGRLGAETEEGL